MQDMIIHHKILLYMYLDARATNSNTAPLCKAIKLSDPLGNNLKISPGFGQSINSLCGPVGVFSHSTQMF
jgi:hypothetical protein